MAFGALISATWFSRIFDTRVLLPSQTAIVGVKKTYNNAISVLKRVFDFGYRDRPVHENPALNLRCARLRKADRPKVDPFSMHDAESLIAAVHRDGGEAQGNYDEFRFFTGLRPSEQIDFVLSDIDLAQGIISVNKARVSGVDRDKTKNSEDRRVQLCPRALSVLRRHLRLRASLEAAEEIDHEHVFFVEIRRALSVSAPSAAPMAEDPAIAKSPLPTTQVTEPTDRLVPLHTLQVPIAATKPATSARERAVVPDTVRSKTISLPLSP
jgi:integrase